MRIRYSEDHLLSAALIGWLAGVLTAPVFIRAAKAVFWWVMASPFVFLLAFAPSVEAHPIDMEKIAWIESSNNPNAVSRAGAIGLFQIMPITLKHFNQVTGMDYDESALFDPIINRQIADWYFDWLYRQTGSIEGSIIGYNFGLTNWRKWKRGEKKLPRETQNYLAKYWAETKS